MSNRTLLLVDDSKSARFMIKKLIEKLDIKVDTAESGEEALEYLKNNKPDVIFIDHLMPGLDGLETTQAIKSNPDTNEIPVVLCTSNDGPENKKNAIEHGAIDLLAKPPSVARIQEILALIDNAASTDTATAPSAAGISEDKVNELVEAGINQWVSANLAGLIEKAVNQQLPSDKYTTIEDVKVEISTLKTQMEKVLEIKAEQAEKNAEDLAKQLVAGSKPSAETIAPVVKELLDPQLVNIKNVIQTAQKQVLVQADTNAKQSTKTLLEQALKIEQQGIQEQISQVSEQLSSSDFINKTSQQVINLSQEKINLLSAQSATAAATQTAESILQTANQKLSGANSKALIYSIISMVIAIGVSVGVGFVL